MRHIANWSYSWAVEAAEGAASWAAEWPLCLETFYLMTFLHGSGVGLLGVWGCSNLNIWIRSASCRIASWKADGLSMPGRASEIAALKGAI